MELFLINQKMKLLQAFLEDQEAADDEKTIAQMLADCALLKEEKILNSGYLYKGLMAEAAAIHEEEKKLADRRHGLEAKAETLKRILYIYCEGNKYSDPRVVISFRKSEAVDVWAEDRLPDEFFKIERTPKKAEIKEALKKGFTVSGARLVTNNHIQIK